MLKQIYSSGGFVILGFVVSLISWKLGHVCPADTGSNLNHADRLALSNLAASVESLQSAFADADPVRTEVGGPDGPGLGDIEARIGSIERKLARLSELMEAVVLMQAGEGDSRDVYLSLRLPKNAGAVSETIQRIETDDPSVKDEHFQMPLQRVYDRYGRPDNLGTSRAGQWWSYDGHDGHVLEFTFSAAEKVISLESN